MGGEGGGFFRDRSHGRVVVRHIGHGHHWEPTRTRGVEMFLPASPASRISDGATRSC